MATTGSEGEGKTSKTLLLIGHGSYDKLRVVSQPRQEPQAGEILVHIKACGINFAELMARQGMYDRAPKTPCVLGYEGSGVVVELGEGVTDPPVGTRVMCVSNFGLWREYAIVKPENVFPIPDRMSHEEAAAIPVNYLTAHMMLFDFGNLRKNQSVLVHMAAGGVGIAATQLCKTVPGVTVFGTASAQKHDIIREEGCTHPIDYRTQDYVAEIRKIKEDGVDIVLDPLSGEDSQKGFNLLRPMGKIIHFGAANAVKGPNRSLMQFAKTWWSTKNFSPLGLMSQNKAVCGFHLGYLTDNTQLIRGVMQEILELYDQDKIKPRIDSVWAMEDYAKAMAQMHERKNVGKVILSTEKEPESPAETAEQPAKEAIEKQETEKPEETKADDVQKLVENEEN